MRSNPSSTNDGFYFLVRQKLDEDVEFLTSILLYHMVEEKLSSKELPEQTEARTLEGSILHVNLYLRSQFFKVLGWWVKLYPGKRILT